jgi:hypothetical protein
MGYNCDFCKYLEEYYEMLDALIKFCINFELNKNKNPGAYSMFLYCEENFIPIIEKVKNKKWEDIIKELP